MDFTTQAVAGQKRLLLRVDEGGWFAYRRSVVWRNYFRSTDTPCGTDAKDQIGRNEAPAFGLQAHGVNVKNCKKNDTNQAFAQ